MTDGQLAELELVANGVMAFFGATELSRDWARRCLRLTAEVRRLRRPLDRSSEALDTLRRIREYAAGDPIYQAAPCPLCTWNPPGYFVKSCGYHAAIEALIEENRVLTRSAEAADELRAENERLREEDTNHRRWELRFGEHLRTWQESYATVRNREIELEGWLASAEMALRRVGHIDLANDLAAVLASPSPEPHPGDRTASTSGVGSVGEAPTRSQEG